MQNEEDFGQGEPQKKGQSPNASKQDEYNYATRWIENSRFLGASARLPYDYIKETRIDPTNPTIIDSQVQTGTVIGNSTGLFFGLFIHFICVKFKLYTPYSVNPLYRNFKTLANVGGTVGTLIANLLPFSDNTRKFFAAILTDISCITLGILALPYWLFYRNKNDGCDLFLMSNPNTENPSDSDYKVSDGNHLYLYKTNDTDVFYYIQENGKPRKYEMKIVVKEISDSLNKATLNDPSKQKELSKCDDRSITDAILSFTSQKKHTKNEWDTYTITGTEGWSKYGKTLLVFGTSLGQIGGALFAYLRQTSLVVARTSIAIWGGITAVGSFVLGLILVPLINWCSEKFSGEKALVTSKEKKDVFRNNYIRAGMTLGLSLGTAIGFGLGAFLPFGSLIGATVGGAIGSVILGIAIGIKGRQISEYVRVNWKISKDTENSWDYATRTTSYAFTSVGALIGFFLPVPGGMVAGVLLGGAIGGALGWFVGLPVIRQARQGGKKEEYLSASLPWTQRVATGVNLGTMLGAIVGLIIGAAGGPLGIVAAVSLCSSIGGVLGSVVGTFYGKKVKPVLAEKTAPPAAVVEISTTAAVVNSLSSGNGNNLQSANTHITPDLPTSPATVSASDATGCSPPLVITSGPDASLIPVPIASPVPPDSPIPVPIASPVLPAPPTPAPAASVASQLPLPSLDVPSSETSTTQGLPSPAASTVSRSSNSSSPSLSIFTHSNSSSSMFSPQPGDSPTSVNSPDSSTTASPRKDHPSNTAPLPLKWQGRKLSPRAEAAHSSLFSVTKKEAEKNAQYCNEQKQQAGVYPAPSPILSPRYLAQNPDHQQQKL